VITLELVRGSAHFTAGSISEAVGVFRLLRLANIPSQRHRIIREAVLVPSRLVDDALAQLDHAGYDVQSVLA
jgi:hypothetical protein